MQAVAGMQPPSLEDPAPCYAAVPKQACPLLTGRAGPGPCWPSCHNCSTTTDQAATDWTVTSRKRSFNRGGRGLGGAGMACHGSAGAQQGQQVMGVPSLAT